MTPVTKGWTVALAGLGINLALGILYTWSVVESALVRPAAAGGLYEWTARQASLPYIVALGCFALTMVFAGRLYDRLGPRWIATAGGVLVGLGMIVASLSPVHLASESAFPLTMALGFGVLNGIGIGFAYAAATPAAVKWFTPGRRGLITGVVVSGFGLASLYAAPLMSTVIRVYGIQESFLFLGVVFFVIIAGLAQLLVDPPLGYVPPGSYSERPPVTGPHPGTDDWTWRRMAGTRAFWLLWTMLAFVSLAALAAIGELSQGATARVGDAPLVIPPAVFVAFIALGSGLGQPVAGAISDRISRQHTMLGVFAIQAVLTVVALRADSAPLVVLAAALIGATYGASLVLFPAATFDFFGLRHAGANYGLVFTAWGLGGVLGVLASEALSAAVGGLALAALACVVAAALTFLLRAPTETGRRRAGVTPDRARRA